jgi:hypothetical protein
MSSAGTETASFSSPSHSIRLSRPWEPSVKPINRMLRKCIPCISTIFSTRWMGNGCRSDRRSANDARWVKRVRDSNEVISEHGTVVLAASGDNLQAISSTAKCLSAVSEVRGKSQVKSYREDQTRRTRYWVDPTRVSVRRHRPKRTRRALLHGTMSMLVHVSHSSGRRMYE